MTLESDCQMYHKLDSDNATQSDSTSNGNDGTVVNATYDASGKIGGCYDFDGTGDHISYPTLSIFAGDYSVSIWVYSNDTTDSIEMQAWGARGERNAFAGCPGDGSFRFFQWVGSAKSVVDSSFANSTWVHYLFVHDQGTGMYLYKNGSIAATTLGSFTPTVTSNDNTYGSYFTDTQEWKGLIDEVGIWNVVLDGTDASTLYNSGDGLQFPFSSGTGVQINIGDAWKEVSAMQINIGDAWKAVGGMQINIGDAWKTVF